MTEKEQSEERKAAALANKKEDIGLVQRVRDGDYSAFERLMTKYEARIYHHCLKFLRSPEDAEDALQESFLQAYRAIDSFRGESAFSTWLFRIATNNCLMRLRKNKRVDFVSIDKPMEWDGAQLKREIVDWSQNPSLQHSNDELHTALHDLIGKLPEDKRITLIMKDIEGFSNIEISEMLGMSVAAVKSRLHRARLQMREELTRYFEGSIDFVEEGRKQR